VSSDMPIFFSSFIDIALCRPTGGTALLNLPSGGSSPPPSLSFPADQREAPPASHLLLWFLFLGRFFFLSPLLLVADQREAPRCRPSRCYPPSLNFAPLPFALCSEVNSACQLGSFFKLIGCCHLRIELNAPSCDRPFVPPRPRSHPDSAIGVSRHPS
jgi:hypothetical protein